MGREGNFRGGAGRRVIFEKGGIFFVLFFIILGGWAEKENLGLVVEKG